VPQCEPDAAQVGGHHLVVLLLGEVNEPVAALADAGVVERGVDPAVPIDGGVDDRLDVCRVRDVAGLMGDAVSLLLEPVTEGRESVGRAGTEHDGGAFLAEDLCGVRTDAGARTQDQHHLVGQQAGAGDGSWVHGFSSRIS
jgi:hypothetical protein